MIRIDNREDCCGCSACSQICPSNCIEMKVDAEGFMYPYINASICVNCNLCEAVCPVWNQSESINPIAAYAVIYKEEGIREQSSSGGFFSALSDAVLSKGGVVFGAQFDSSWQVEIAYTENKEEMHKFRGSKYVQANPRQAYVEARNFLQKGRRVLFSGTPCQITGLRRFLRKDYENLLAVDFICHGTPSPKVWEKYLYETLSFVCKSPNRGKTSGKYNGKYYDFDSLTLDNNGCMRIQSPLPRNHYMMAFLNNLILRPSCYKCPSKSGKSHSDIPIADFWGIQHLLPSIDDNKGISLVAINTNLGNEVFQHIQSTIIHVKVNFEHAISYNPSWRESSPIHPQRKDFFQRLDRSGSVVELIDFELNRPNPINLKRRFWIFMKELKIRGILPVVSRSYVTIYIEKLRKISFRDKSLGWKNYQMVIDVQMNTNIEKTS